MAALVPLRPDFDAVAVHREARRLRDRAPARWLLAPAAISAGASRGEAATIGGVTLPIVRDCVVRFNAERPGRAHRPQSAAPKLGATDRWGLLQMVEHGPTPAIHGVVRWQRVDLAQWIWEEFRISVSTQTLSRERRRALPAWRSLCPPGSQSATIRT